VRGVGASIEPFKHATLALVAIAYTVLAFADGGYSQRLTAAATIAVWLAVGIGALARAWPRRPTPRAALAAGGCLGGLGLVTALSMIWADDAGRAFFALVRIAGYLGLFALVVVCAPRSGRRAWLAGLAAGLTLVCAASLGTRFDPSLFGGGDRELSAVLPTARGRLSYPIGYWNGLAACLAVQFVLLVWFGARARTRAWRAVSIGLIPLPVLALYLTSSRGGFIAALAGWLVVLALERAKAALLASTALGIAGGGLLVLFARPRGDFLNGLATSTASDQGLAVGLATLLCVLAVALARYLLEPRLAHLRLPRVSWRIAAPAVIAAAIIVALAVNPGARLHQFATPTGGGRGAETGSGHLLSAGGSNRAQYWEAALDAFATAPIGGVGAGNYELYWNAHPEVALPVLNAHSVYLETLAELGLVGLAALLGFLGIAAAAGWRRRVAPGGEMAAALAVLAAGAVAAGLDWTWQIPAAFAPVVVAVGLLTAGQELRTARPAHAAEGPSRRLALGIAVVAIGWVSIWAAGVVLVTRLNLDSSRDAAARGDLAEAADDARDAADVEPWSPEPRLQLALVDELGGDLQAARSAAGEAIDRAPGDWRPWAVAARVDVRAGDRRAAAAEIYKAGTLSPVALPAQFTDPIRRRARG
jgi:hypothetical protein